MLPADPRQNPLIIPARAGRPEGIGTVQSHGHAAWHRMSGCILCCDRSEVDIIGPSEGLVASSILAGRTTFLHALSFPVPADAGLMPDSAAHLAPPLTQPNLGCPAAVRPASQLVGWAGSMLQSAWWARWITFRRVEGLECDRAHWPALRLVCCRRGRPAARTGFVGVPPWATFRLAISQRRFLRRCLPACRQARRSSGCTSSSFHHCRYVSSDAKIEFFPAEHDR